MPDDAPTTDAPATDDAPTPTNDTPLGDAGQKALDAMKAELKTARAEARTAKALQKELDDLKAASATDAEKAIAAAEARGEQGALGKANARIIRAEVKAAAAGKLTNPEIAPKLLDLSEFTVDDEGEVDAKAIAKAIDVLLAENPYLAAGAAPRVPGVPAGARPGSPEGGDMNALIRQAAGRA